MSTALLVLAALALVSIWLSGLTPLQAVLASAIAAMTTRHALRRQHRQAEKQVVIPPGPAAVLVDGMPVQDFSVVWRGSIATLVWRADGSWQRLLFWPDTLTPAQRRELRLAAHARGISPRAR